MAAFTLLTAPKKTKFRLIVNLGVVTYNTSEQ